jgi:hypothetical protein
MLKTFLALFVTFVSVAGWVGAARAVPYVFTDEVATPGQPAYITVGTDTSVQVYVNEYHGTFTPPSGPGYTNLAIDCFDPFVLGSASSYDSVALASVLGTTTANRIGALLAHAPESTTVAYAAAREGALLELIYDPSPGDVASGYLRISGFTAAETLAANLDVADVLDGTWTLPSNTMPMAWVLADGNGQRFAWNQNVPEPASLALLAMALIGLGTVRHRSRTC